MRVLKLIAWLAIGPAVYVNIEATPMPWTPFAIGSVIFAAVFVSLAQARRSFWFGALGAVFILIDLATALGNVATMSDETRDGRNSAIERKQEVDGKRAALNIARKAQVVLAGELPGQTIEGQLQALIASDAPRWTASGHCDPDKVAQSATRTLCDQIAKAQAKKAAALKRDEIDAKLAEVDKETVFGAPSSADPYAESLARFLTVFGYQPTAEGKALLSASKDWGKAIGLEVMAAFGPMGLTLLFELMLLGSHPAPVPVSGESRAVVEHKPAPVPAIELPAAPHVTPAEAPAATPHVEAQEPAPAALVAEPLPPPSPPRKRAVKRKLGTHSGPGAVVIPFAAKKPTAADVLALLANGKTQIEAAEHFSIGLRTVQRIVASQKSTQIAPKVENQNPPFGGFDLAATARHLALN
jgi:hypothetical protein